MYLLNGSRETDEYETDITDKKELQIRDTQWAIFSSSYLSTLVKEDLFPKILLLLMLSNITCFWNHSSLPAKIIRATRMKRILRAMGFESNDEYNEIMFLREITHTVNAFNDMADIMSSIPETDSRTKRLENLLSSFAVRIPIRYRTTTGL